MVAAVALHRMQRDHLVAGSDEIGFEYQVTRARTTTGIGGDPVMGAYPIHGLRRPDGKHIGTVGGGDDAFISGSIAFVVQ